MFKVKLDLIKKCFFINFIKRNIFVYKSLRLHRKETARMGINSSFYQHQCNGFSKKTSSRFSHSQYTKKEEMGEKVFRQVITEQDVNIYDDSIRRTHDLNKVCKYNI